MSTAALLQPAALATQASLVQQAAGLKLQYRALQPKDFEQLRAVHAALFPIDYEDGFFIKATNGLDRIWSCAAVSADASGEEQLVGFVTAKLVFLHEVDASDRQHMGLLSAVLDHDRVLYLMTLGVLEGHRHRGIARTLIAIACQHAFEARCRAVFLHVITYNTAAIELYSRHGFSCVAKLRSFYYIATGRTPDPHQQVYDAYLFVQHVGGGGLYSPWDLVSLAWSPLRLALNRIHACMPGFCRHEQQPQQEPACGQQQQQQQPAADQQQYSSSHTRQQEQPHCALLLPQLGQQPQQQQHYGQQRQQHANGMSLRVHNSTTGAPHGSMHTGSSRQRHRNMHPPKAQWQQRHQQVGVAPQQQPRQHLSQQQQQQPQWQQLASEPLLPPQQQQQQQPYMLHHGLQPPPQRMLRWLFNGASRSAAVDEQQWQPLSGGEQQQQQQQHHKA